MNVLAVIDATGVEAPDGPATIVAGLSLVERTIRLAAVCGADEIVVRIADGDDDSATVSLIESSSVDVPVFIAGSELEFAAAKAPGAILVLDAGVVFDRSMVKKAVEELTPDESDTGRRDANSYVAIVCPGLTLSAEAIIERPAIAYVDARPMIDRGWSIHIDSDDAARQAARRLFNGCRKPEDGLVARYLNRHISLAISRVLAPTKITPNHISAVTFTLGIVAALSAAWGGFLGFLLAGILYQANSVIDGVDGELARVRYEFSFLGEWLDTISDDMADFLLYIGLGVGAWRTMADAPGPLGSELWLILGITAAVAKVASMVVYYRWLIANNRGDLLAFQWSFEDDETPDTPISRALSVTHYFFRKDFIVFVAMVMSFGGFLPHLLFALAPGNAIVAISVVVQQLRGHPPGD